MPFDSTQMSEFAERRGTDVHALLWVEARNRQTGATEGMGLWTGDDHQAFTVDGQSRTFHGAGAVIGIPPIRAGIGLQVRRHRIVLPPMNDELRQLLQVYQAAQARVWLWLQPMSIDSGAPLGAPRRIVKGRLEEAPETLGRRGDRSRTELAISSTARALTIRRPLFKSDAAQRLRDPADRAREHVDAIGERTTPWGQSSVRAGPAPAPADPVERGENSRG